jgi:hypothetical protein
VFGTLASVDWLLFWIAHLGDWLQSHGCNPLAENLFNQHFRKFVLPCIPSDLVLKSFAMEFTTFPLDASHPLACHHVHSFLFLSSF